MNSSRCYLFFFFISLFVQSCNPQGLYTPSPIPATGTNSSLPIPSIVLHPEEQTGQEITIAVGEVFAVSLPDESFTWQINFADAVIQMLTPLEKMSHPDSPGWLFQAIAKGRTEIRVTSVAENCDPGTPCPPAAPISFVFTIEVK